MGILPLTDVFGKMAEQDGGLRVAVVGLALGCFAEYLNLGCADRNRPCGRCAGA
jgi:hypothetical protein